MRGKLIAGVVVLAVVALLVLLSCSEPENEPELVGVPLLGPEQIRDPEIAPKYGIRGYLDILPAEPQQSLSVSRGGEANLTILLHFVSYTPELTEIEVSIDPEHTSPSITQSYSVLDAGGKVTGEGAVQVNDIVSYSPSGTVMIKAGETLPVTMTVRLPENIPEAATLSSIPLGAVGIRADIPTLSELGKLEVMVRG